MLNANVALSEIPILFDDKTKSVQERKQSLKTGGQKYLHQLGQTNRGCSI